MRYVYRRDDDVPARPNANHNTVTIGAAAPVMMVSPNPIARGPFSGPEMCPAWGCGGPPVRIFPYSYGPGATATAPQLPPGQLPGYEVTNVGVMPLSPAPAPTVAVSPSQTAPSLLTPGVPLSSTGASPGAWTPNTHYAVGQAVVDPAGHVQQVLVAGFSGPSAPNFNDVGGTTIDGQVTWSDTGVGGSATAGIGSWLAQSTLISGFPNWGIAGAAILGLMFLAKRK